MESMRRCSPKLRNNRFPGHNVRTCLPPLHRTEHVGIF